MAFSFPTLVGILVACLIFQTRAQISTPCTSSMISTFTPCINYVTGSSGTGSSPTQSCCDSLKSLMGIGMECACLIVTGNVPVSLPFVNRNLAISLPKMCHNSVPVQCKASGDQLPAPGPALFGPSQAPTSNDPIPNAPAASTAQSSNPASVLPLSPSANPGIRPVVHNPTSDSHQTVVSWLVLGIMALVKLYT